MNAVLENHEISRVSIIDDVPDIRNVISMTIEDMDLEANPIEDRIINKESLLDSVLNNSDAVICDHNLKGSNYSNFNGAELVCMFYENHIPAVLSTAYNYQIVQQIRKFKEKIPVLIKPDDLQDIDTLWKCFDICKRELEGEMLATRRPWRAVVRVETINTEYGEANWVLNVKIPEWDTSAGVEILRGDLPTQISSQIREGTRLRAFVNTGAEREEDLYFKHWEILKV